MEDHFLFYCVEGGLDPILSFMGPGGLVWFSCCILLPGHSCKLVKCWNWWRNHWERGVGSPLGVSIFCTFVPNLHVGILMPDVMVLGGRACGQCSGHKGAALQNYCFIKETSHSSLTSGTMGGNSKKMLSVTAFPFSFYLLSFKKVQVILYTRFLYIIT